jgi:hypothetical protein
MGTPEQSREKLPSNPFADSFEAKAGEKPKLDIASIVDGYPDNAGEIKEDKDSSMYKKIIAVLLPKLKARLKKKDPDREPQHGDVMGGTIDNRSCFLVYDERALPHERVFMTKAENEKQGSKQEHEPIPADKVTKQNPGYNEIPQIADKIAEAKNSFKKQNNREMEHGETAQVFDLDDFSYIVLRDESKPGTKADRLFKSKKPIPA